MDLLEQIRTKILSWPEVEEKPNKFGTKRSYFVKGKEFCHFHNDSQMDIMKTKIVTKDKRIEPNPYSDSWVWFNFKNEKDARMAINICKAAYQEVVKCI